MLREPGLAGRIQQPPFSARPLGGGISLEAEVKKIAVGDLGEFWYGDYKEPFEQLDGGVPGHPVGVVLKADDGKLLCAFCGKLTEQLGNHAHVHGMTAAEYKDEVGLLRGSALVSERVRQTMIARGLRSQKTAPSPALNLALNRSSVPSYGARNKRRPEALNKTGRCLSQLVAVARTVAAENGGRISMRLMRRQGVPQNAMLPYGGFQRIAQLAGATARAKSKRFTDAELLTVLRTLAMELGRTPSESDLRRYGLPSNVTYVNHFGHLSEAQRRAGLVPNLPVPLDLSGEIAILVAYATLGNISLVAQKVHRGYALVRSTLLYYGIGLQNWGHGYAMSRTPEHREAMERAAEIARRLADWPQAAA